MFKRTERRIWVQTYGPDYRGWTSQGYALTEASAVKLFHKVRRQFAPGTAVRIFPEPTSDE